MDFENQSGSQVGESQKNNEHAVRQLIVFKLGQEEYALPIDDIKEVVLTPKISRIPQTPFYVKGVANIRGNVISIIDLEERFNLVQHDDAYLDEEALKEAQENISANYTLVIESKQFKVGILVREVPNTLSIKSSEIDNTTSIIQHTSLNEEAINGIVKLGDRMIIMIDIIKMMASGDIKTNKNSQAA
jgi:purine-binding chemotaxis protein CheW